MRKVKSRLDLRHCDEKYVMVTREDQVYMRVGSEYVMKRYWTTREISLLLKKSMDSVYDLLAEINIKPEKGKKAMKINLQTLRQIIEHAEVRQAN